MHRQTKGGCSNGVYCLLKTESKGFLVYFLFNFFFLFSLYLLSLECWSNLFFKRTSLKYIVSDKEQESIKHLAYAFCRS